MESNVPENEPEEPSAPYTIEHRESLSEEEKSSMNSYRCNVCTLEFYSKDSLSLCARCGSTNIHQHTAAKSGGFFSSLYKQAKMTFNNVYTDAKNLPRDVGEMYDSVKDDINVSRLVNEAYSMKDLVVYRTQRNENGVSVPVEVNLEDIFRPLIRDLGLTNSSNPNHPATDRAISKLEGVDIEALNADKDETEKVTLCSICQCELDDETVKTKCEHYYHRTCLIPWLKIHNRCPV